MKKLLILAGVFYTLHAQALIDPTWERPIWESSMDKIASTEQFEGVVDVSLTLTKRDGEENPTGLTLQYGLCAYCPAFATEQLEITHIEEIECGSTLYVAQLPVDTDAPNLTGMIQTAYFDIHKKVQDQSTAPILRRVSIVLTDHSTRYCEDLRPYIWEAEVREGYGWCGTGDATMSLVGNPKPVYTIQ